MILRRRPVEPGEPGRLVTRDAVPVEQQLAVQRLRSGIAGLGPGTKKRRALPGVVRDARGGSDGGGGIRRQNLNSTVPNTVRPGAMVA